MNWRLTAVFFIFWGAALGLEAGPGTEAAAFLDIPAGGRPASMGGAYTAVGGDAYSLGCNPAALLRLGSAQAAAQHVDYPGNLRNEHVFLASPLASGQALGVSGQYFGVGGLAKTNAAGLKTGEYSDSFGVLGLSYSREMTPRYSIGVTGKIVQGRLEESHALAYGGDIGTYYSASPALSFGAALTNIGTRLKFAGAGEPLPWAVRLGTAFQARPELLLALDGTYGRSGEAGMRAGLEWRMHDVFLVRAGYRSDVLRGGHALSGLSTGIAISHDNVEFAYAWIPLGLGNTNYFSVLWRLKRRSQ